MEHMLVFSPPNEGSIENARVEDILDRILNGDAAYWGAGVAHATVYYGRQGGGSPSFVLMLTKFGFYVEAIFYSMADGRRTRGTYIPDANLGRTEVDEPWAGQNPMRIPKDFCLGREQCAQAVRYFCETGERDPRVNWVDSDLSGWDTNVDG
jgi:Immunity protein Imm1